MKHYKELLLRALMDSGWELVERVEGEEWWLEEWWKIRSVKQHWGYELFIVFLTDPMYAGVEKHRNVWAIAAFTELPGRRPLDEGIATIALQKGKFDTNLGSLIGAIDQHRHSSPRA
jgi:hypothetical protein